MGRRHRSTPKKRNKTFPPKVSFFAHHFGEDAPWWKRILKRLSFIALGVLVTIPIRNETGPLRFIGLSLLFSGYHLFMLVVFDLRFALEDRLDRRQLLLSMNRINHRSYRVVQWFSAISAALILLHMRTIENTLSGSRLYWPAAAIGLVIGAVCATLYLRRKSVPGATLMGFTAAMLIGCTCFTVSATAMLNRYVPVTPKRGVTVVVKGKVSKGPMLRNRWKRYYLIVQACGSEHDLRVSYDTYSAADSHVVVTLQKGLFGFDYVSKVNSIPGK